MSFTEQKITDAEIEAAGVQSQPNKLAGTAQQNKAVFDALIKNLVKVRLNALIDELLGNTAAGQIGIGAITGYSADTVQEALEEIVQNMQDIVSTGVSDGSVTTAKLADEAVTTGKLADEAVTTGKLDDGAVTAAKLAAGAVTSVKITDGNVTAAKLAAGAVTTGKIVDGNVTTDKLADGAVTAAKLASIKPEDVGIKIGNKTPTTDDISEGEIYFKYT